MTAAQRIDQAVTPMTASGFFASGKGKFHSDGGKKPRPLTTTSMTNILAMMEAPQQCAKDDCQWVITSTLLTRNKAAQLDNGRFLALWGDLDGENITPTTEVAAMVSARLSGARVLAYSSSSATEQRQKARILIPLADHVDGVTYQRMARAFNDLLAELGFEPDRIVESANQVLYLPNRGEFYATSDDGAHSLDPAFFAGEVAAFEAEEAAEEAAIKAARVISAEALQNRMAKGEQLPITAFDACYDVETMWRHYGATGRSGRLLSPFSESGSPAIRIKDGKWYSDHGSDVERGIGRVKDQSCWGSAFDLFKYFEHGNDERAAVIAAGKLTGVTEQNRDAWRAERLLERQRQQEATAADQEAEPDQDASEDLPEVIRLAKAVDLTSPPGLAGRICDHMKLTAPRRLDEAYPFAALHLMALAGRKRKGYKASQLKLNTLTIALSAAGKDHPQEILATLSNAVGLSRFIQGNAGSHSDIIQNLIDGHGCSLYSIDEIHSLFSSMSAKNAESYDQKMAREILTMSTSRLYLFRGIEKRRNFEVYARKLAEAVKKRDNAESTVDEQRFDKLVKRYEEVLHNLENGWPDPFFSMMGHSVPRKLDSIANVDTIEEGLIGRCLIVRCRETREELTLNQASELDVKFSFEGCVIELERVMRSSGSIIADDEAAQLIGEAVAYFDRPNIRNDESMGAVYSRAPQQILKVASIMGVDGGVIRREHALYAVGMVMQTIRDIRYLLSQARAGLDGASKEEIIEHAVALILKQCRSGECRSVLAQKLSKNVGFKKLSGIEPDLLDKLLSKLQEQGRIEYNDQGRSKRYRTI